MTLGSTLRRLRRDSQYTLERLGELAGVDASTISRLENDENPRVAALTLSKLARALGIDVRILYRAAGWYSTPPKILAEEEAQLTPHEQTLIDTIRSAPTSQFRESLLHSLIDLATIARNADADRHRRHGLSTAAEEREGYTPETPQ